MLGQHSLLEQNSFFVREHVAMLRLVDTFDILDPQTGAQIGVAREEPPDWIKWLRLLLDKKMLPTVVNVYGADGFRVLTIRRPFTFLRASVTVTGPNGETYGSFRSKLLSIGGGFWVYDQTGNQVAEVHGDWKGWNFRFVSADGRELGTVTKKWAGIGRELFTSADNYMIALNEYGTVNPQSAGLLLAAGIAIDTVYKERG